MPETTQEFQQTETNSTTEVRERLGKATGVLYDHLLDESLGSQSLPPEELDVLKKEYLNPLPHHLQPLYEKGFDKLKEILDINHNLVPQDGEQAQFLLAAIMPPEEFTNEQKAEILRDVAQQTSFREPFPGVYVVQVEHEAYALLQEKKVIPSQSQAVALLADNLHEPSFFIYRRYRLQKSMNDDPDELVNQGDARHELHHVLWHFLRQSEFVRPSTENSLELKKAFESFRDEVVAYTVQKRPLTDADSEALVYTTDEDISKLAYEVRNICALVIEFAKRRGENLNAYYFPAMTATTFEELKINFINVFSLDQEVGADELITLLDIWQMGGLNVRKTKGEMGSWESTDIVTAAQSLGELLKAKGVSISSSAFLEFSQSIISRFKGSTVSQLRSQLATILEFGKVLKVNTEEWSSHINELIKSKLPLPAQTQEVILGISSSVDLNVPISSSSEEFLNKFINVWQIKKPDIFDIYLKVIRSSSELQQTFLKIGDEIKRSGLASIKREFGSRGDDQELKKYEDQFERLEQACAA